MTDYGLIATLESLKMSYDIATTEEKKSAFQQAAIIVIDNAIPETTETEDKMWELASGINILCDF